MFKTILKTAVLSAITITFLSACGAATKALNGAASNAVNLALQDAEKRYLDNIEEVIDENGNTIQVILDDNGKRFQVSTDDNGNSILTSTSVSKVLTFPPIPEDNWTWRVNYDDNMGVECTYNRCRYHGYEYGDDYHITTPFNRPTAKATYAGKVEARIEETSYANDIKFSVDFVNKTLISDAVQMGDNTLTINGELRTPKWDSFLHPAFNVTVIIDGYQEGYGNGIIGADKMVGAFRENSARSNRNSRFIGRFSTVRQ